MTGQVIIVTIKTRQLLEYIIQMWELTYLILMTSVKRFNKTIKTTKSGCR